MIYFVAFYFYFLESKIRGVKDLGVRILGRLKDWKESKGRFFWGESKARGNR